MSKKASTPGHFSLLYFASAASFTRKASEELPAPSSITELFAHLEQQYPGIKEKILSSSLMTINLEYVDVDGRDLEATSSRVINEGDEVAIIPPCDITIYE
ncbi:MAG: hypothetical protein Q9219_002306 [cf. Caloplaca sp. 3 TL-2023]